MRCYTITKETKPTKEHREQLKKAQQMPIVVDEDSPEITAEMMLNAYKYNKDGEKVYLHPEKRTSEAQKRATNKYQKKTYDRIVLRARKDSNKKAMVEAEARKRNKSVNEFFFEAVQYVIDNNISL